MKKITLFSILCWVCSEQCTWNEMLQLKNRIKRSKHRSYLQTPASFIVGTIFKSYYNVLKKNGIIPACFVCTAVLVIDIMLRRSRFPYRKHVYLGSHLTPAQKGISPNLTLKFCISYRIIYIPEKEGKLISPWRKMNK